MFGPSLSSEDRQDSCAAAHVEDYLVLMERRSTNPVCFSKTFETNFEIGWVGDHCLLVSLRPSLVADHFLVDALKITRSLLIILFSGEQSTMVLFKVKAANALRPANARKSQGKREGARNDCKP